MKKSLAGISLSLIILLASCGQSGQVPEPNAATSPLVTSTPLQTGSDSLTAQYLYVDKSTCPDQVSYVTEDVNKLDRYVCTFATGGLGAATTTIACAASVGWGCIGVGGAVASLLLGCTEVYAPKQVRFKVTKTYMADNFYRPVKCFLDRTTKTPI